MKDPRWPKPVERKDGKLICPMCGRVARKKSDGAYYCTYEGWESFDPGPLGCLTCGGTPDMCAVCPLKQTVTRGQQEREARAEQIIESRGPDASGPYGDDLLDDWRYEVANGDTRLGYQEWCEHQRELAQDEAETNYCLGEHDQDDPPWLAQKELEDLAHDDEPWLDGDC